MLSTLFTSVTDALISYAIDKLDPAERIKSWLRLDPARLAFKKALARAYSAFARQYPEYTSSLFDQSFLSTDALPELSKLLTRNQHPDPALLAQAWGYSLGTSADFAQAATKPAAYFLERFEAELKAEPALQSLFDSRGLESLPKLEAEIQKLSTALQRGLDEALKAASDYQKVTLHIGRDIKDSNIIIGDNNQLTVNKYYYSGDFVSLNEYYIPPDGVFQRVRVDEFVGRDWLTAKVDAFLNDPNRKSGAFLLIGDAGVGKTSFMAHLVKERRYLHLFAEQAPGQAMLQRAMQSLGSQLVTRYQIDPYKDRDTLNALSVFPDFLERILRLAASTLTEGEKIVIVCDALDEAGTFPDQFVFGLPKELPDSVYFILSQRPVNVKLPNFEPLIEKLEAQGEDNLQDIEAYLSAVVKRPEVGGQIHSKEYSEDFFIQTLKEKSQGVWMYLHYIIKEIESGARAPLDLANLPTGLVGYYAEYWDTWRTGKRGKGEEAWDELYVPLLTTLAAAQEAITIETLIQWAGVTAKPREATRLLTEHWRAFITEKEVDGKKAYVPYHLSFKDFITGRVDTDKLPPAQANLVKDLADQTVDAHKRIVNAFEKECGGEWEKLVEQDYPRLHLSSHLNGAGEYEKLRILLTEGDEKIKWAEAREKKEETYAGYLNDLTYVWDYAERELNYALVIRCMLIETSIHSIASSIFPELLLQLAKTGLWSYARCLSTIRGKSDSSAQKRSLKVITSSLPPLLFQDALATVHEIKDEFDRASALADITPHLNDELKVQALTAAREIKNEAARANALVGIVPHLNDELKTQVLAATREIKFGYAHTRTLVALAPHFNDKLKIHLLLEALATAREIKNKFFHAHALANIAPHLNDELKTQVLYEALAAAREIKEEPARASALEALVRHHNDELKTQVLAAAREIKDEHNRADVLAALTPHLNDELKTLVLIAASEIKEESARARVLAAFTPHTIDEFKTQVLLEVLAAAGEIKDEHNRAHVLESLMPYLNDELKTLVLTAAREIKEESARARVLAALTPHLSDELKIQVFLEVLASACEIKDEDFRARILVSIAPDLNDELMMQVLAAAHEIKDAYVRAKALVDLVPHLSDEVKTQVLHEALVAAREIKDEHECARALTALALHLSNGLKTQVLYEALSAAYEINDKYSHANALEALAPHFSGEIKAQVLHEMLITTRKIKGEIDRASALAVLAPYLNEASALKTNVLAAAREIKDEYARTDALEGIVPYLSDELKTQALHEALAAAREIKDEHSRALQLVNLVPHLNGMPALKTQALHEALAATREIKDEHTRAFKLVNLVPHLNDMPALKIQAIHEALAAAREIKDECWRVSALGDLVPHLSDKPKAQVLQEALTTAREIKDEYDRSNALEALAPHLSDKPKTQVLHEALVTAREIKDEYACACALMALAPHFSNGLETQVLHEALTVAREIKYVLDRASVLTALAPHLSNGLKTQVLQEALSATREIDKDEDLYVSILLTLAQNIDKQKRITILQEILYLPSHKSQRETAKNTWKEIGFEGLEEKFVLVTRFTSQKDRENGFDILDILTPALVHFRGPEIADELYRTITDVTRWWQ